MGHRARGRGGEQGERQGQSRRPRGTSRRTCSPSWEPAGGVPSRFPPPSRSAPAHHSAVRRPTRTRTRSRRRSRRAWEEGTCAEGGPGGGVPSGGGTIDGWRIGRRRRRSRHRREPGTEPPSVPTTIGTRPDTRPDRRVGVPEEPGANEGIALAFRVPGGGRLQRRFRTTDAWGRSGGVAGSRGGHRFRGTLAHRRVSSAEADGPRVDAWGVRGWG